MCAWMSVSVRSTETRGGNAMQKPVTRTCPLRGREQEGACLIASVGQPLFRKLRKEILSAA